MKLYDISPTISSRIGVFPGDQTFEQNHGLSFGQGHHLDLSSIKTTVHLGAHADAPLHYHSQGESIESRSLNYYLGPCQVITVYVEQGERVRPEHLKSQVIKASRVLFATNSYPDPDNWNSDFCSLSPQLIEQLALEGVRLVGIDTPSIDPEDSKKLESHQAIYEHDMAILEGLVLKGVPDGEYELIALPLKIEGSDASPVRAVLRS